MSSSGISFSGLFSGLDTENIIEQLIKLERRPIILLEQKKTKLSAERENLMEVNNSLLSLKGTLPTLASGVTTTMKATSSDEDILVASANAGAAEGVYSVIVNSLARAHITGSNFKNAGWQYQNDYGGTPQIIIEMDDLPGGPLVFDQDSGGSPINIAATDSLTAISSKINSLTTVTGESFGDYATAFIVTSQLGTDGLAGTADDNSQSLVIQSKETGANYAFDTAAGTFLPLFGENNQGFANAQAVVNGITVNSSSNQIADAIYGVTLDLKATSAVPVNVSVGVDDDSIVDAVKEFVAKFNESTDLLANFITEDIIQDPSTTEELVQGVLRGDFDLVSLKGDIRMRTTGYLFSDATNAYRILADIGIASEPTAGTTVSDNIELNEDKLRAALSTDREAVSDLLANWADKLEDYVNEQTKVSMVKDYAGTVYARILGIKDSQEAIDDDISMWEERVSAEEERLRNSFTMMEQMLQSFQSQSTYISQQLQNLSSASAANKK